MKRSIIKSLLALLLVANPVAVLASDFHDLNIQMAQATDNVQCHPVEQQETPIEPLQHHNTDCDMPCCQESECSGQGICIVHYSSDIVIQKLQRFGHPIEPYSWGTSIVAVPDRVFPPENPPPIHL